MYRRPFLPSGRIRRRYGTVAHQRKEKQGKLLSPSINSNSRRRKIITHKHLNINQMHFEYMKHGAGITVSKNINKDIIERYTYC